jgi:hypothetical protein
MEREIPIPPSDKHVLAMLKQIPDERRLLYAWSRAAAAGASRAGSRFPNG